MSNKKYVGITIGPISDTLDEASTPAALWFASYTFSDITRRICEALYLQKEFSDLQILSPYYSNEGTDLLNDGVGKYHDRIVFSTSNFQQDALNKIIEDVKNETSKIFYHKDLEIAEKTSQDFLRQYLQIHYVVLDAAQVQGNSILAVSSYLDDLELMKTFPNNNDQNPFRRLFRGKGDSKNQYIKESQLFRGIQQEQNQFFNQDKSIREIKEIANFCGYMSSDLKKSHYYAVVQADGDGMGKFLNSLDDEGVTVFSKGCLEYAKQVAMLVGRFGGMTIYAGGDDLLFLAPVEDLDGEKLFDLCARILALFQKKLSDSFRQKYGSLPAAIPTLSFGISIQYEKYPLYEARANAGRLLFEVAKKHIFKDKVSAQKNCMAIEIQKHSGQTMSLVVANESLQVAESVLNVGKDMTAPGETVTSVIFAIETFDNLLTILDQQAQNGKIDKLSYMSAWMNLFDNVDQKPAEGYLQKINEIYYDKFLRGNSEIETLGNRSAYRLEALAMLLRVKKFLVERSTD